jgi:peptidoglycan glycosyltransferase
VGGYALADWAGRLGFGAPIDFDLRTAISQVTNGGGSFGGGFADRVELANAAYGQGETLVTPLQMAWWPPRRERRWLMRPHLVLEATGKSGTTTIGPSSLQRVVAPGIAREIGGDAQAVGGDLGGLYGRRERGAPRSRGSRDGRARCGSTPHSWFIGFAPFDSPQVASPSS